MNIGSVFFQSYRKLNSGKFCDTMVYDGHCAHHPSTNDRPLALGDACRPSNAIL